MSTLNRLRSIDVSPRTAIIAVLAVVAATVVGVVIFVRVVSGSAAEPLVADNAADSPSSAALVGPGPTSRDTPAFSDQEAHELIVRRALFQPSPAAFAPKPAAATGSAATPSPGGPRPQATTGRQPQAPAGPAVYCTGIVDIAGVTYALLEDAKTGVGEYAPVDGTAMGYRVKEIGDDYVVVEADGKTMKLSLRNEKPEATAGAPPTEPPPPPGAGPGPAPPQAPAARPTPPGPGATPQDVERYRQLMRERYGTQRRGGNGQRTTGTGRDGQ